MVSFSTSKPPSCYEVRSISLPPRSHPTTLLLHELLHNLKSFEPSSSSSICIALSGLAESYRRINDLLNLSTTQQALSQRRHKKWVDELVNSSMRLLDVCGTVRDTLSSVKEALREVQSSLRRRKPGDSSIEPYISFVRRAKKETDKSLGCLKRHVDKKPPLDVDHHVSAVVRVVREAGVVAEAVFGSLLSFLSAKQRCRRWCAVARMVHECEWRRERLSEFEDVKKKMEGMDMAIEGMEDGLERVFRRLIHNRVSFLNILSTHF